MRLPYACFWLTLCRNGNQKTVTVREDRVGVRKRHIWLTLCPQTFFFILKIYSLEISHTYNVFRSYLPTAPKPFTLEQALH